jgi:hypothetical protein
VPESIAHGLRAGLPDARTVSRAVLRRLGKPVLVDIPNAGSTGSTQYKVTPALLRGIEALEKADQSTGFKDHNRIFAQAVTGEMRYNASSVNPDWKTSSPTGANNALASVHANLQSAGARIGLDEMKNLVGRLEDGLKAVGTALKHVPGINKALTVAALSSAGVAFAQEPTKQNGAKLGREVADLATGGLSSLLLDSSKGPRTDAGAINDWNQRVGREQKFLLSEDHPGQLGVLKTIDGKPADVEAMLRDPSQRHKVFKEIDDRIAKATDPNNKEVLKEMKEAAKLYTELEDRRRPLPESSSKVATAPDQNPQEPKAATQMPPSLPAMA